MSDDYSRKVYSSETGRIRQEKEKPQIKGDGRVRVRREVKGRGGKTVTAIHGLPLDAAELKELASELKRSFGVGGSAKDGVIEIQGDYIERSIEILKQKGFQAKRGGG